MEGVEEITRQRKLYLVRMGRTVLTIEKLNALGMARDADRLWAGFDHLDFEELLDELQREVDEEDDADVIPLHRVLLEIGRDDYYPESLRV